MLASHVVCVTQDESFYARTQRVLANQGVVVRWLANCAEIDDAHPQMLVWDGRMPWPHGAPPCALTARVWIIAHIAAAQHTHTLARLVAQIRGLEADQVDHVIAIDQLEDLGPLWSELASRQGHPTLVNAEARCVHAPTARGALVAELRAYAELRGVRGTALVRWTNVVDELLMNALVSDATATAVRVAWQVDAQRCIVEVTDSRGDFERGVAFAAVGRAITASGRPQPVEAPGAGIGLYLVLAQASRFIVTVLPGESTRVIAIVETAVREVARASLPHAALSTVSVGGNAPQGQTLQVVMPWPRLGDELGTNTNVGAPREETAVASVEKDPGA